MPEIGCKLGLALFSKCIVLLTYLNVAISLQIRPNVVIFLVDDLGVADLGCFGNGSVNTPNIDRLASQGARLTHSLSSESICTPSRAAFLTGRYAVRSGMVADKSFLRVLFNTAVPGGLPQNETTFADSLKSVGYSTALIGKWHLGLHKETIDDFYHHPLKFGFQSFYGIPLTNLRNCDGKGSVYTHVISTDAKVKFAGTVLVIAMTGIMAVLLGKLKKLYFIMFLMVLIVPSGLLLFMDHYTQLFNCFLMRNYTVVEQPILLENLTARFTHEAIEFIERTKDGPFLLFMSYFKVHTALFTTKAFKGRSGHSSYVDNVEELDWSVGQIMSRLDELGIRNDTFVYFTSDNGPHLEEFYNNEYQGGWKGIFKGGKGQSWEGGIRVPSIASWPSQIPSGIDVTEPNIDLNIYKTVINIANASLPVDRIIDSEDIMPLLKQQVKYTPNEFMYHYCAKALHAVRYRPRNGSIVWKLHYMTPKWDDGAQICTGFALCGCYGNEVNVHDPPLLYDITNDPGEQSPLDPSKQQYKNIARQIAIVVKQHQDNVDVVPIQLNDPIWRPWLQPCCNFPSCRCIENGTDFLMPS